MYLTKTFVYYIYLAIIFGLLACESTESQQGEQGESCTAVNHEDGSYTISCPDSDPVTVVDGESLEHWHGGQRSRQSHAKTMAGQIWIAVADDATSWNTGSAASACLNAATNCFLRCVLSSWCAQLLLGCAGGGDGTTELGAAAAEC